MYLCDFPAGRRPPSLWHVAQLHHSVSLTALQLYLIFQISAAVTNLIYLRFIFGILACIGPDCRGMVCIWLKLRRLQDPQHVSYGAWCVWCFGAILYKCGRYLSFSDATNTKSESLIIFNIWNKDWIKSASCYNLIILLNSIKMSVCNFMVVSC